MGQKVATAVLEITTDTSPVKAGMLDMTKSADGAAKAVERAGMTMSRSFSDFGSHVRAVQTLVNDFSGDKAIQQAHQIAAAIKEIGGAQNLTKEQQKSVGSAMEAALSAQAARGQQASATFRELAAATKQSDDAAGKWGASFEKVNGALGAFGLAVGVGSVIAFGRSVLEAGDQIQKMADQTGMSTDEVQKLMYISGQSGSGMDALVTASQNLQQRLGDNNAGLIGGIKKFNINLDEFKSMSAYEQMTLLADRVKDIKNPTDQASAAAEIFGKSWKEILPAVKAGMTEVGEHASIMSSDVIQSLDRIGDVMTASKQNATAWGAQVVLAIEGVGWAVGQLLSSFNPSNMGLMNFQVAQLQAGMNDPNGLAGAAQRTALNMEKLSKEGKSLKQAMEPLPEIIAPTGDELAKLIHQLDLDREAMNKATVESQKAIEAQRKWRDSVADATVAANLGVFALNKYGAVALPAVTSSLKGADREFRELASTTLPDLRINLNKVGQAGVAAGQGAEDGAKKAHGGLSDLAQAFAQVAQVSGGSFGGALQSIGQVVTGIDLATKSMGALNQKTKDFSTSLSGTLGLVSSMWSIGTTLQEVLAPVFNGFQQEKIDRMVNSFLDPLAKAKQEADERQSLMDEASTKFGPSQDELNAARDRAAKLYEFMRDDSTRTSDQVHAAYVAMQEAMAAAGDKAAQEWVDAQKSADTAASHSSAVLDGLVKQRDGLISSIANEAPEEVAGVIETQARGQIAALDREIDAQHASMEEGAHDAVNAMDQVLRDWSPPETTFPYRWEGPAAPSGAGGVPVVPMAAGGLVEVDRPTLFLAGEAGREQAAFSGGGRSFAGASSAAGSDEILQINVDGRQLARVNLRHLRSAAKKARVIA